MNKSINNNYIEYKIFCNVSAYDQQINENLIKLFITVNNRPYFPEFIDYEDDYGKYPNTVRIKIERIYDIVDDIVYYFLNDDKCDEIEF